MSDFVLFVDKPSLIWMLIMVIRTFISWYLNLHQLCFSPSLVYISLYYFYYLVISEKSKMSKNTPCFVFFLELYTHQRKYYLSAGNRGIGIVHFALLFAFVGFVRSYQHDRKLFYKAAVCLYVFLSPCLSLSLFLSLWKHIRLHITCIYCNIHIIDFINNIMY